VRSNAARQSADKRIEAHPAITMPSTLSDDTPSMKRMRYSCRHGVRGTEGTTIKTVKRGQHDDERSPPEDETVGFGRHILLFKQHLIDLLSVAAIQRAHPHDRDAPAYAQNLRSSQFNSMTLPTGL